MENREVQRVRDQEHLNILGIFNFVFAGLSILMSMAFIPHLIILQSGFFDQMVKEGRQQMEREAERYEAEQGEEFPVEFDRETMEFVKEGVQVFVLVFFVLAISVAALCLFSGLGLRGRRWRSLSMVTAVLQCFAVPLGTILGIFTIVVISRYSVQDLYDETADPDARYDEER